MSWNGGYLCFAFMFKMLGKAMDDAGSTEGNRMSVPTRQTRQNHSTLVTSSSDAGSGASNLMEEPKASTPAVTMAEPHSKSFSADGPTSFVDVWMHRRVIGEIERAALFRAWWPRGRRSWNIVKTERVSGRDRGQDSEARIWERASGLPRKGSRREPRG